jgi:prolyl-tRNA synthetase
LAPFKVHLILLGKKDSWTSNKKVADKIYSNLLENGIETLYDDREDCGAGEKFAEADLIGCPLRLVISDKTLKDGMAEFKRRNSDEVEMIKLDEVLSKIAVK